MDPRGVEAEVGGKLLHGHCEFQMDPRGVEAVEDLSHCVGLS